MSAMCQHYMPVEHETHPIQLFLVASVEMDRSQRDEQQLPFNYFETPVKYRRRENAPKTWEEVNRIEQKEERDQYTFVEKYEKILERVWYIGHISIMCCSVIGILLCVTRQVLKPWPRFFYRLTFAQIVIVYGLSLMQSLRGAQPGFFALLPLATFQYVISAALSIVTVPHTIKLTPYALLSVLHVASVHSQHHSESKFLADIFRTLNEKVSPQVTRINAYLDLWLLVELAWDCILIRPGAVIALGVYSFLFKIRLMYSPVTQGAVFHVYKLIDERLVRKDTPKHARELWIRLRNKLGVGDLGNSDLYAEDTDKAIDKCNLMGTIYF